MQAPTDLAYSRSRLPLLLARMRETRLRHARLGPWCRRLHAATVRTHADIVRHVAKRWRLP